jgi:hypothetical protein
MKLNASMLVVVAMVVGSVGAMGCKSQDKVTDTGNDVAEGAVATPEDNPVTAAVSAEESATAASVEQDYWRGNHYWANRAPPAARYEGRGVAPAGHFWRDGYYGWSGRDYSWNRGGYYPERPGYRYANPGWSPVGNRWGYRPGRWVRR